MFVRSYPAVLTLAVLGVLSPSQRAEAEPRAETNAECARAYEEGQEQRRSGQLVAARQTLQTCARDECPEFIRADCSTWYGEVQNEVPTLVFVARSQGRDLSRVRVLIGDRELSSHIDGQVVELDPGEYDIEFQALDMRPLQQHFVIARGERNRLIQVELEPLVSEPEPEPVSVPRPQRSLLLPGLVTGVGVLGVAGFAGLGLWGHSRENELKSTCAPDCTEKQLSAVRTRYLMADVSLGLGVASLALGAYLFFDHSTTAQARTRGPRLGVLASPSATGLVCGGQF